MKYLVLLQIVSSSKLSSHTHNTHDLSLLHVFSGAVYNDPAEQKSFHKMNMQKASHLYEFSCDFLDLMMISNCTHTDHR